MRKYVLSLGLAMVAFVAAAAEKYADISTEALKQAIERKKVVLLDVNGSESWSKHHIPGALDFEALEGKLAEKLPADKNTLIVAYCGNEHCGAYQAGAKAAQKLGYKNVKHYAKGIQGWLKLGERVEKAPAANTAQR